MTKSLDKKTADQILEKIDQDPKYFPFMNLDNPFSTKIQDHHEKIVSLNQLKHKQTTPGYKWIGLENWADKHYPDQDPKKLLDSLVIGEKEKEINKEYYYGIISQAIACVAILQEIPPHDQGAYINMLLGLFEEEYFGASKMYYYEEKKLLKQGEKLVHANGLLTISTDQSRGNHCTERLHQLIRAKIQKTSNEFVSRIHTNIIGPDGEIIEIDQEVGNYLLQPRETRR